VTDFFAFTLALVDFAKALSSVFLGETLFTYLRLRIVVGGMLVLLTALIGDAMILLLATAALN